VGPDTITEQHPVDRIRDEVAARFLRRVWEELERRYAPQHVILFGSRATGRARPDSDLDLILVSPRFMGQRLAERSRDFLLEFRPYQHGISADVLCYTPEEFAEMSTGIGMVAEAVKEGVWVR
jgi:predicted nucleotidyltransferase